MSNHRRRPNRPAASARPVPVSPAQREAEGPATAVVEWQGLTFRINADPDQWNFWTVTLPLSSDNLPQSLRGLLGPEQMARLQQAKPRLTNIEARELFNKINETLGFTWGN
ncbi:hypothetical protein ACFXHA_45220 [Nocardia sp. NPDC059240]|uniref:hypothetical protein n=1 Tax=Nocardia sp. NPDC059240 TaxID=3346786 RepID=UPI003692B9D6